MTFGQSVKTVIDKSIIFSGRASRSEFWKFILFLILVQIALIVVNSLIFGPDISTEIQFSKNSVSGEQSTNLINKVIYNSGWLGTIASIILLIPLLSVATRRLHDIGRAGWHVLALLAIGFGVAFLISFLNITEVPFDTSQLPKDLPAEFKPPETIPSVNSIGLFFIGWLAAFGTMITTIVWLAKKSQPESNKYGPNPTEASS